MKYFWRSTGLAFVPTLPFAAQFVVIDELVFNRMHMHIGFWIDIGATVEHKTQAVTIKFAGMHVGLVAGRAVMG